MPGTSLSTSYTLCHLVLTSLWKKKVLTLYIFDRWAHGLNNLPKVTYVVSDGARMWCQAVSDSTVWALWTIILYTASLLKTQRKEIIINPLIPNELTCRN